MRRGLFIFMAWICVVGIQAQSDFSFILNKEGKIIVLPKNKTYELNIPKASYKTFTPAGTRETARDLLQDGFVKIFTKIRSYSGSGAFGGWIRRIFVTTALEYLRSSENTRLSVGLDGYDDSLEDINYSVLDRLSADDLLACVAQLPLCQEIPPFMIVMPPTPGHVY